MSALKVGPRTLAGLVVVLTFVVGGLAGAVMDRGFTRGDPHRPPRELRGGPPGSPGARGRDEQHRERFVQQLTRELQLNPQQVAKIDTITRVREQRMRALWAEVQPRVDALLNETRREIDQVLTPAQRAQLEVLRRQHEARMHKDSGSITDTTGGKR